MQEVASNGNGMKIGNELLNEVVALKEGIVPALQMLEAGYNEMKEHLDTSRSRDLLPATNIMKQISEGMRNVEHMLRAPKALTKVQTESRKLLHSALDVSDVVNAADEGDWEKRYESQDLPNIGERRSLLKKRGQDFKWTHDPDSTLNSNQSSPNTTLESNTPSQSKPVTRKKRRSRKELAILQNQKQDEEALR